MLILPAVPIAFEFTRLDKLLLLRATVLLAVILIFPPFPFPKVLVFS